MSLRLSHIYESLPDGSDADEGDRAIVDSQGGKGAATYGEISLSAGTSLLNWLKLTPKDCFVDCGSGVGKFVLQCVLETQVGSALGIELSPFRHEVAVQARKMLMDSAPCPGRVASTTFICGDFRGHMPPGTSVVYAGSLCFSPALMSSLAQVCLASASFRLLCTLKELPSSWVGRFSELGAMDLEMTWSRNNRLFIYGRKGS